MRVQEKKATRVKVHGGGGGRRPQRSESMVGGEKKVTRARVHGGGAGSG